MDDRGNIVQNVKSLYNGLGYFNIYPDEGRTYYLNCKSTEGIEKSFILPAATLSIGIKVHFKEDQILVSALKPEHLQFKDTLYILLQSEDSIVYKDIWDFSRRWIVFEKKNIKTGLSSFLLVDSNGDLLSGRPFFKLENISSLQSLPPDFKIRLLPIMNDPGTDSIRKNLVLDTLAKTLTIDQEQSEPDKRPNDDIWKTIELENVEIKAFKKDKQNQGLYSPVQASSRIYSKQWYGIYIGEVDKAYDLNNDGVISYVMFKGQEGNMEAIARTKYGVEDANAILKAAGKPELKFYDSANKNKYLVDQDGLWSSAAATNYMSTALAQYTESNKNMIELVIANNDEMALGAISALQTAGYNKDGKTVIPVFGVDATDAAKSAIKSGSMIGTIKQDAEGMATAITTVMKNLVNGTNALEGIDSANTVGTWRVNIPYSAYTSESE